MPCADSSARTRPDAAGASADSTSAHNRNEDYGRHQRAGGGDGYNPDQTLYDADLHSERPGNGGEGFFVRDYGWSSGSSLGRHGFVDRLCCADSEPDRQDYSALFTDRDRRRLKALRLEHCERIQPLCPNCWLGRQTASVLEVSHVARLDGDEIVEGSLVCPERLCQREHPIIDGIPVLLANPQSWIENQLPYVMRRRDLYNFTESMLGDIAGSGSAHDRERGNNGIYAHAHWAVEKPAFLEVYGAARRILDDPPKGMWLDIGCSVGRGTFELAKATGDLAVGVDLNFSMLRLAQEIRRTGRARYARRRVGLVFDFVDDPVPEYPAANVSFWCTDVTTLPFAAGKFDGAMALNMLDCVPAPLNLLCEMGRVLRSQAEAVLSTPFDWAAGGTDASAWLGGHSQRSSHQGSSLTELRRVLSRDCQAGLDTGLWIETELDSVKWRLRTHERSTTEYDVYIARLRRKAT